jgi:putative ABC transport system permease protein
MELIRDLARDLIRDLDYTFRLLVRSRGFAFAVLVTIALGVGGTAAVFSVVYGVLHRPLPYPEPERLVRMW